MISTVVSLTFGGRGSSPPPTAGSSAEEAQALLPGAKVVAASPHSRSRAGGTDHAIECDLLTCGRSSGKAIVTELGTSMGLRTIDVGGLGNAAPLEGITAVLATVNRRYKLKNSGIKITGL